MDPKRLLILVPLILFYMASACTNLPSFSPESQGLVIVRISINDFEPSNTHSRINTILIDHVAHRFFPGKNIVIPIDAGEHSINGFISGSYRYGLKTGLDFTVKAGGATNIGHIIAISQNRLQFSGQRFRILTINNDEEIQESFSYDNAELYARLKSKTIASAKLKHLTEKHLQALRTVVAKILQRRHAGEKKKYLLGSFGVAMYFKSGKVEDKYQLLKTNTTQSLKSCVIDEIVVCVLNNKRWLKIVDGKVIQKNFSEDMRINTLVKASEKKQYLMTQDYRIFTLNKSQEWQLLYADPSAKTLKPLIKGNSYAYFQGKNGSEVIYSKNLDKTRSRIYLRNAEDKSFSSLVLDPRIKNIGQVHVNQSAVFVLSTGDGPASRIPVIYVRKDGQSNWSRRQLESGKCYIHKGSDMSNTQVNCSRNIWKSGDLGKTWKKESKAPKKSVSDDI